jgi:hypothetical protein
LFGFQSEIRGFGANGYCHNRFGFEFNFFLLRKS